MHWVRKGLWALLPIGLALIVYCEASNCDLCPASALKDTPYGCVEFWFNRYQTLLSAMVAFIAAWVAVRPVWKQLYLSAIQTKVSLRESISSRASLLATRSEKSTSRLEKFWNDFGRGYEVTKDDAGKLSHWIWDQQSIVDDQIAILEKEQSDNIDGDETTISRQKLLTALRDLEKCIYEVNETVHLGYSVDGPVEDAAQVAAEEQEAKATAKLPDYILTAENEIVSLSTSFDRDVAELRLKRQLLDQMLAASEVD